MTLLYPEGIEGNQRTHLSIDCLCTLGRLRCHLRDWALEYNQVQGKSVHRKHAYMHTQTDRDADEDSVKALDAKAAADILYEEVELEWSFALLVSRDAEREGRSDEEVVFLESVRGERMSGCYDLVQLDNVEAKKVQMPVFKSTRALGAQWCGILRVS